MTLQSEHFRFLYFLQMLTPEIFAFFITYLRMTPYHFNKKHTGSTQQVKHQLFVASYDLITP